MYLPPQFKSSERGYALALMRGHPLASLISNDDSGLPFITHLPLHVEEQGDELRVTDLQCKLKLNQHRPEARSAMKAMYAQGTENERELAGWMDRLE